MVDVWAQDASGGAPSYSAQELRLLTALPFLAGAGASLGVRSGVRLSGSGTDLLVQAQAAPNMSVRIQPGAIVVQGAISATQGPYTWVNDTTLTRTIAAAHASLSRTDLVVVRIRDASVDTSGARDGDVIVITGTAGGGVPSLPTDATYITIAQVAVGAAVSSIVAGNITDRRPFTAALGAPVPCLSTARPTGYTGLRIWETDTDFELRWSAGKAKYLRGPVRVKATQTSFPNTTFAPVTGMSIPLEANSVYEFDLLVYAGGFQNVGLMLALQLPSLATLDTQTLGWRDDTGAFQATSTVGATGNAPLHAGNGWGYNGSGNFSTVTSKGTVTTAGTAGSAVLLGCQRVSSGNQSQVGASSWMELRQVA